MTWDDETRARAAGMKRAGMTNRQIADRLGVTVAAVQNQCKKQKAYRWLDHRTGGAGMIGKGIAFSGHSTIEDLAGGK